MNKISFDFKGRTAIVTGGAQGFGLDITKRLIRSGANVIIWDNDQKMVEKAIEDIKSPNLSFNIVDISNYSKVEECVQEITKQKNIDILINNAGIANTKLLHKETYSELSNIIDTNLLGSLNVSNAIIPKMIVNKRGKIINIASTLGYRPLSYVGAYSATKAALIQVTKSQSIELARYNICVNALAPGYIMTDINIDQLKGETGDLLRMKIPLKRFATVDELDTIISMLLNTSNTYMTGAVVAVDGGLSTGL